MASIGQNSGWRTLCIAALVCLVFLTGGPAWAGGLVLCVCHDGHVSLETTCQPLDCCPGDFAVDAAHEVDVLVCADANEEHPCVDVPLLLSSGNLLIVPAKISAPSPVHVATADFPCEGTGNLPATFPARASATDSTILPSDTLLSRSTVLLI